jgi:hypothetical protein
LFGFGVSLAVEREQGMLTFRQAIPTPAGSFLVARMVMAMMFVAIVALCMITLATLVAHVPLTFTQGVTVFFVNVIGVLPFCAIGLFIGSIASGQAAPAIVNLFFLPLAFLSGLWLPLNMLGNTLQQLAPLWPPYHLLQLSLQAVDRPYLGSTMNHVGALVGITVVFFYLALRRLGGISLFSRASAGTVFPLRRALGIGMFWIAVGLVVAGVMGGNAPQATASPAATSKDAMKDEVGAAATEAASSASPIGVAAPDTVIIANFEDGSERTSYGMGWHAADDKVRGGNSTITQQLVGDGAQDSKAALEITGQVGTAIQYPFVGTSFLPNGTKDTVFEKQGFMDFSKKHTLSFFARGDGQMYTVVFMGPASGAMPGMYGFTAGPEWQQVRIPLKDVVNTDLQRIRLISIGSMNPGAFRFQIDDVRVE